MLKNYKCGTAVISAISRSLRRSPHKVRCTACGEKTKDHLQERDARDAWNKGDGKGDQS